MKWRILLKLQYENFPKNLTSGSFGPVLGLSFLIWALTQNEKKLKLRKFSSLQKNGLENNYIF